jgi:hypothetical protein
VRGSALPEAATVVIRGDNIGRCGRDGEVVGHAGPGVSTSYTYRRQRWPAALSHHLGASAAAPDMVAAISSFRCGCACWDLMWGILGSHTDLW